MYTVQLEKFSGPLDLLLKLIEDQKLDITEISLARVADQFLDHLKNNKDISSENLASFLVVAAKLILIKSKALLPVLELTDDEEEDIKDLEQNLIEYKKFKEIAELLGKNLNDKRFAASRKYYEGSGAQIVKSGIYLPDDFSVEKLTEAFIKIVDEIPKVDVLPHKKIKDVVTLEEKIGHLRRSLEKRAILSFTALVKEKNSPVELIVTFLAVLEMIKQKFIIVEQYEVFGEMTITKKELEVSSENAI